MLKFLPLRIKTALEKINLSYLYEIRIRAEKPIRINYGGNYEYLSDFGITEHRHRAIICTLSDIDDIVFKAGKYSVYSVEEQLKKGFITAEHGERIGISGEYVFEKGQPFALRNFTSLCIRVPHEIKGCGAEIYKLCMSDRVQSVLLMSSPGLGKTTILRDLSRILSEKTQKNILICDERGELSVGDIGDTCDVLRFSDKSNAFEAGIRAMRPEIIVTDELSFQDCSALERAIAAGITVLASAHFSDMQYVRAPFTHLFDRYVLLDECNIGKIKRIYNREGTEML